MESNMQYNPSSDVAEPLGSDTCLRGETSQPHGSVSGNDQTFVKRLMWIEKYKPMHLDEISGNTKLIEELKKYIWKKPLLIYGPPGVGKTVIAEALAADLGFELTEIENRNIENSGVIMQTSSIFGSKKLILIDNVDKIDNISLLTDAIKETKNPVILITSDFQSKRLKTIKLICEKVQIRRPLSSTIANLLQIICRKEGIEAEKYILAKIAENSNGDVRSAINDLEMVAEGKKKLTFDDLEILEPRDRVIDIYNSLSSILVKNDFKGALRSTMNLDLEPRDTLLWIDENLPRVFRGKEEISRGYYYLSKADIFIGRILSRQYWGFLRYANSLMTGGVNISRGASMVSYLRYQFPMYIAKMGQTKKERSIKKSISGRLSQELHVSSKIVVRDYIPLFRILLKNKKISEEELTERYKFRDEELEYLKEG